jgi:hypothetical protein
MAAVAAAGDLVAAALLGCLVGGVAAHDLSSAAHTPLP